MSMTRSISSSSILSASGQYHNPSVIKDNNLSRHNSSRGLFNSLCNVDDTNFIESGGND